jgi:CubicO group peptidase (beta-lactamase class C family)
MGGDACQYIIDEINRLEAQLEGVEKKGEDHTGHGGAGGDIKAKIAAKQKELESCHEKYSQFVIEGTVPVPGKALKVFDQLMEDFCRANLIRAAQLTIIKNGVLKFQHAYTLLYPPDYYVTQITDVFRLASVSKMFTCAAIYHLYTETDPQMRLSPGDKVFPTLGITEPLIPLKPNQTLDPNIDNITVQNLVLHAGGWNDGSLIDQLQDPNFTTPPPNTVTLPSGQILTITRSLDPTTQIPRVMKTMKDEGIVGGGPGGTPTKMEIAQFMYGLKLDFPPGLKARYLTPGPPVALTSTPKAISSYSNFGYLLLGLLVEKKIKNTMTFIQFVREKLLPLGLDKVYLAPMMNSMGEGTWWSGNPFFIKYDSPGIGPIIWNPTLQASAPYGGGGFITELIDSAGGLAATATECAYFVTQYPAWGIDGIGGMPHRRRPSARRGGLPGTATHVESYDPKTVSDKFDFAWVFNTRHFASNPNTDYPDEDVLNPFNAKLEGLLDTTPIP